jgi:hypothetical protein
VAGRSLLLPGGNNNGAQYFDGSSSFSSVALSLSSWNQLSVSAWVNWTAFSNNDDFALEYSTNYASNNGAINWNPNSSSPHVSKWDFVWHTSGGTATAGVVRPAAGQWHHVLMLIDGTVSGNSSIPAIYIDGGAQSISYGFPGAAPQSLGNFTLYLMSRAGAARFGQGGMAQLSLFAGTLLGADDAMALAGGADPRSVSTGATHFWRMDRKGAEPSLGRLGAAAGTMTTNIPGMLALPAQLAPAVVVVPWASAAALAGAPLTAECVAPVGLSATLSRQTAIGQEAGGRITAHVAPQLGIASGAVRDGPLTLETASRSGSGKIAAIEVTGGIKSAAAATIESPAGLESIAATLVESSGSVVVLRDATPPIEMLAASRGSAGSPVDARASLASIGPTAAEATVGWTAPHGAPVEWTGAVPVTVRDMGDIEFAAKARSETTLPGEWLTNASFVINESDLPFEWLGQPPAQIISLHRLARSPERKRLLRAARRTRLLAKD